MSRRSERIHARISGANAVPLVVPPARARGRGRGRGSTPAPPIDDADLRDQVRDAGAEVYVEDREPVQHDPLPQQMIAISPEDFCTLIQGLTTVIQRISALTPSPPLSGSTAQGDNFVSQPRVGVTEFSSLRPPTFSGTETPIQAEGWLTLIESIFRAANVPEEIRVGIVQLQLTDIAYNWWLVEQGRLKGQEITWAVFRTRFFEKYFPESKKYHMVEQFTTLRQRGRPLEAYIQEFDCLEKFAPHIVPTELDRVRKFHRGLDIDIQRYVIFQRLDTLDKMVTAARDHEYLQSQERGARSAPVKRDYATYSRGQDQQVGARAVRQAPIPRQAAPGGGTTQEQRELQFVCYNCGRSGHLQKDCSFPPACFACGFQEHLSPNCPLRRAGSGGQASARAALQMVTGPIAGRTLPPAGRGTEGTVGTQQRRGPLPSQSMAYRIHQIGRGQVQGGVYAMTVEKPETRKDVAAGGDRSTRDATYIERALLSDPGDSAVGEDYQEPRTYEDQIADQFADQSYNIPYRDRAAERRSLHGEYSIGPGQKNCLNTNLYEEESTSQTSDPEEAAAEAMNMTFGKGSYARKLLEKMGWKDGEALGSSTKGILEPLQAVANKGKAGLGWRHIR